MSPFCSLKEDREHQEGEERPDTCLFQQEHRSRDDKSLVDIPAVLSTVEGGIGSIKKENRGQTNIFCKNCVEHVVTTYVVDTPQSLSQDEGEERPDTHLSQEVHGTCNDKNGSGRSY